MDEAESGLGNFVQNLVFQVDFLLVVSLEKESQIQGGFLDVLFKEALDFTLSPLVFFELGLFVLFGAVQFRSDEGAQKTHLFPPY